MITGLESFVPQFPANAHLGCSPIRLYMFISVQHIVHGNGTTNDAPEDTQQPLEVAVFEHYKFKPLRRHAYCVERRASILPEFLLPNKKASLTKMNACVRK